jgi:hypothetical protein
MALSEVTGSFFGGILAGVHELVLADFNFLLAPSNSRRGSVENRETTPVVLITIIHIAGGWR